MTGTPIAMNNGVPHDVSYECTTEQIAAAVAPLDRHCLVLAGAGCGKTTVLTRRIIHCIETGMDDSRILALTFTRKAAANMAMRLRASRGKSGAAPLPAIMTFHAFALKILSEKIDGRINFDRIGFYGTPRWCSDRERHAILMSCTTYAQREALSADIIQLDALIERLHVFPDSLAGMPTENMTLLRKIADDFKRCGRQEGVWHFSDLLDGVIQLFSNNMTVLTIYQQRYSAVLIDEFQDTSPLQIKILHLILGKDTALFAVGDDDQAIYGFRGADRRPTLSFPDYFPEAVLFKLQTNYRNTPAILNKANVIFADKAPDHRKVLVSGRFKGQYGERPSMHRFKNQESLAAWIIDQSKHLWNQTGISCREMALLFRVNYSAVWMAKYFSERNIPPETIPQMLTIHKSKGLEFPVVFLCDLEESVFPLYRVYEKKRIRTVFDIIPSLIFSRNSTRDFDLDLDEERRLFYVAVTRAQSYLYLLSVQRKHHYQKVQKLKPSRFLKYMS